jgi:zinc transport system substrate-binding protein
MKRIINIITTLTAAVVITLSAAAIGFVLAGCAAEEIKESRLRVAADIAPLADFCREVGGDRVEVEMIIPAGASPHAYELTTGQMKYLSQADVLVINGLDLTPWADDIFTALDNPGLITVVAGEEAPKGDLLPAAQDDHHEHGIYNPHVWLDPNLATYIVEAIRDAFIEAEPVDESTYRANADSYIKELEGLDGWIRKEVSGYNSLKFVSFHPSWTYFARRYGLDQVAVIEELPGKEPTADEIAVLVDSIIEQGVRAIFAEPQLNPQAAEVIAEEAGGQVEVKILDPLGDPDDPSTGTYLEMMRHDVQLMGEVLR